MYVYILRCEDKTLYTGIAADWKKRFSEHQSMGKKCAKYTYVHKAVKVEAVWSVKDKSCALKLEHMIKTLAKSKKEELISSPEKVAYFFPNTDFCDFEIKSIKGIDN